MGTQSAPHHDGLQLGDFTVRPAEGTVVSNGDSVHLEPRVMEVLLHLAEDPGRVCSKKDIFEAVWSGRYVEDAALSRSISDLRKALGDDARQPRYIQTVPRKGYRLILSPIALTEDLSVGEGEEEAVRTPGRRTFAALVTLTALVILIAATWRSASPRPWNHSFDPTSKSGSPK